MAKFLATVGFGAAIGVAGAMVATNGDPSSNLLASCAAIGAVLGPVALTILRRK